MNSQTYEQALKLAIQKKLLGLTLDEIKKKNILTPISRRSRSNITRATAFLLDIKVIFNAHYGVNNKRNYFSILDL